MKLDKNKVIFGSVIFVIILIIGVYLSMIMGADENPNMDTNQIPVPKLEDEQKVYTSKLDALNDLKEVKQTNAPSIYDEHLIDSTGVYNPDLLDKDKMRLVDSIYNQGKIDYYNNAFRNNHSKVPIRIVEPKPDALPLKIEPVVSIKEKGLEHQLFFASAPKENRILNENIVIPVIVDGTQTVKANYRLRMRLTRKAIINDISIPRHTVIYGFVSFQAHRVIIEIENINHHPTKLKAYDIQDGSEGIYIENSFRADATREVLDDVVQDINIAGMPQVSGIKKVFQRNNRNLKVTVLNNYQLLLKTQ